MHYYPYPDQKGNVQGVVVNARDITEYIGIARDITEQKQAEEEKEILQAQFIQAQKMESIGRLAGGVAHDINNKLNVILGYAEFVQESLSKSDQNHDFMKEIIDATIQSTDIIGQLLAFARKQIISPKVYDLNTIIESMLKMLRRLIGEDIDLSWSPESQLWEVKIDPTQIDQILVNLCINARDAIEGVGKITIETDNVTLDEKAIITMTKLMLEKLGYQVLAADTPGKAMQLAKKHSGKIHLLITDVVMPEMNGRDLANQIEDLYPNINTLFIN